MVRFWLAFAAMLWSAAATFLVASEPSSRESAARYEPLQTRLDAARGMPVALAIVPLTCFACVVTWRRREVHIISAFATLGMCFLGEIIYLPAAAILAVSGLYEGRPPVSPG